ncbi:MULTISPECIES: ABC transporter substrate-binding protein [Paenibacillus]|nr:MULTISPECIES: ABC transporter substrate-binding protein [Paenibacillus]ETT45382.1 ABC transporter ferrichrome-binding protein [Paenibacillus sp. FSL H8-237]MEC0130896.1 ABC transporter substrate-binding protein [Paenibacillus odorifer]MEC0221099.1 ABC transporter substrate-binding protein [Paenibacillus odorifer]
MKKLLVLLVVAAVTAMTACSSTNTTDNRKNEAVTNTTANESKEANAANTTEVANTAEAAGKVYSLENDGVDETLFNEALSQFPSTVPERIVTTSVPLTEMLYLLGITPVGVPTSTNPIPADFETIDRIGSPMAPDLEVVTKLEPDLLLGAESLRSTLDKSLEGIDLQKAYLRTESFEDLKLSLKVLGTYFNKKDEMNAALTKILDKENELSQLAEGKELPSVLLVIGTADSFMVMSEKSYLGSLVKKLGADNIATSVLQVTDTYSPINMENIVAADPDIILVLASGDHGATEDKFKKEIEKNETWTKLSAYANNKINILDYSVFGVTSILNAETALTEIAKYFYE